MADLNKDSKTFSDNDPLDINELASLNEDISPEFIEQLQSQVSKDAKILNNDNAGEDAALFEEVADSSVAEEPQSTEKKHDAGNIDNNIDDNFIKKYKARLEKQKYSQDLSKEQNDASTQNESQEPSPDMQLDFVASQGMESLAQSNQAGAVSPAVQENTLSKTQEQKIDKVSGGNITERPLSKEQIAYSEELETIDGNTNYSKYVIYISPENKEFIEGLTVKERKNLINKIIKEQGEISITKHKYCAVQTVIRHIIIAIVTIAIAIPVTYSIINASLEASIDNYRRSKGMFQTLYREHGKIKNID